MNISQQAALQEAGFAEAQTNALVMALEPLATKEDLAGLRQDHKVFRGELAGLRKDHEVFRGELAGLRKDHEVFRGELAGVRKDHEVFRGELAGVREDLAVMRNDLRWMKWVGGAIGIAVLTEIVSGSFS